MRKSKISIIGAGVIGSTTAQCCASAELGDIVLLDRPALGDMTRGKALDLMQALPIFGYNAKVVGTSDYANTANSDIVVITAGLPRKLGMSRDELLAFNVKIVTNVCEQVKRTSPDAKVIVVSNPVDAMVQRALQVTGFPHHHVFGHAGILDSARYCAFLALELGVSMEDISGMVIGEHGDTMVPVASCTSVSGIPIKQLIDPNRLDEIIERTRFAGTEIIGLFKTTGPFYAPAAAITRMVEAIVRDKKRLMPCSAYCDKEYGVGGYYVGVPVVLGTDGVERIIELELSDSEQAAFQRSIEVIKSQVKTMAELA
ncbi:MAG: malate dehydrogenase [Pirellulales bacterium]|nr:malate dehydrogenase [Pirellulales bacterium]